MKKILILFSILFASIFAQEQGYLDGNLIHVDYTGNYANNYFKANGVSDGTEKIIADPYLPNNYLIKDRYGNYNSMVFIPAFNWTPTLGFSAVGRASENFQNSDAELNEADNDTLTLNANCSAVDDAYNGCYLVYNSEWRVIIDYIGASKKAILVRFTVRPTSANTYVMHAVHPAFIVNGVIAKGIYIGKYEANIINSTGTIQTSTTTYSGASWDTGTEWITAGKCAHSKVNLEPQVNIDYDAAKAACDGMNLSTDAIGTTGIFHLITNAEWAAIALWCRQQVTGLSQLWCRGNNLYGLDADDKSVMFNPNSTDAGIIGVSQAVGKGGSGGYKTAHNREISGIFDLNGNVYEWCSGLRVSEGKIYVAGNTNTSPLTGGNSFEATEVNYYDTGLYFNWDGVSSIVTWSASDRGTTMNGASPDYKSQAFNNNNTGANDLLKKLAIAPVNVGGDYGSDYLYVRNFSERLPIRGGSWSNGTNAGVFYLFLYSPRTNTNSYIGFRVAFVKL